MDSAGFKDGFQTLHRRGVSLEILFQPVRRTLLEASEKGIDLSPITTLNYAILSHLLLQRAELTNLQLATYYNPQFVPTTLVDKTKDKLITETSKVETLIHKFMSEIDSIITEFKVIEGGPNGASILRPETFAGRNERGPQDKRGPVE